MARPEISPHEIRAIAVELRADPRSIQSELAGRRVRGAVGIAIRRRLRELGLPTSVQAERAPGVPMPAMLRTGGRIF
jgi:hypothetical protein